MKKLFLIISMGAFLASCLTDKSDEGLTPQTEPISENADRFIIPVEEALDNMYEAMDLLYGPGTRASARAVVSVETLKSSDLNIGTRTTGGSTMPQVDVVHVANFGNNQGFALLGANIAMPPVLAITEAGNLTNETLQAAINGTAPELPRITIPEIVSLTEEFVEFTGRKITIWRCTTPYYDSEGNLMGYGPPCGFEEDYIMDDINSLDHDPGIPAQIIDKTSYSHIHSKKGPFLTTKWHQWEPFKTVYGAPPVVLRLQWLKCWLPTENPTIPTKRTAV